MTEAGTHASPRYRLDSHDGLVLDEVVFLTLRGGQNENR